MTTVMIIMAAAAAGFGLAKWWRVPAAPLLIVIGVALGGAGWLGTQSTVQNAMLLGLTFLVFFVGTELDVWRVGAQAPAAIKVGLAQFLLLGTLAFVAARLLGFNVLAALYIGLALTASSTFVGVTLLRQRQQLFDPFGRLVLGVFLLQDVLVILALSLLAEATQGPRALILAFVSTLGLIVLTGACIRWLGPLLLVRLERHDEPMLLSVVAILFAFVGLAHWLNLPLVTGAFLAGVALSGFPVSGLVSAQITSLADFFLAIFFVSLGAAVTLPDWREFLLESLLIGGVLVLTPPLVMLIVRRAGFTSRASIETAHLLAQCGELSLVVALVGVEAGHLPPGALSVIVMVTVVTMGIAPFLLGDAVTWRLMRWLPGERLERLQPRPRGHILLLGCGRSMWEVLDQLVGHNASLVVVDADAGRIESLRERGIVAIRGDGADYRVLRIAGARDAGLIISTMRRMQDHQRLLKFVKGQKVVVRVFDPDDGRRCEELGARTVVESEAAAAELIRWLEINPAALQAIDEPPA